MTEPLVGKSDDLISEYWKGKAKEKNTIKTCPAKAFKKYCEDEPWMPECKEYDV